MPTSGSFRIMSIDMSLRAAGVCLFEKSEKNILHESFCCETRKNEGSRFNNLELDAFNLHCSLKRIKEVESEYKPDAIIVEFPAVSQNASAGIAIGMCWGIWSEYFSKDHFVAVEPSALKIWSSSKRGDKKDKVKQKVLERVWLPPHKQNDDNIIDAIGLSLLFVDLYHEYNLLKTNKKQVTPEAFRLTE